MWPYTKSGLRGGQSVLHAQSTNHENVRQTWWQSKHVTLNGCYLLNAMLIATILPPFLKFVSYNFYDQYNFLLPWKYLISAHPLDFARHTVIHDMHKYCTALYITDMDNIQLYCASCYTSSVTRSTKWPIPICERYFHSTRSTPGTVRQKQKYIKV
jgi:hypothetical protein